MKRAIGLKLKTLMDALGTAKTDVYFHVHDLDFGIN
jgi:hypothetical protein